MSHVCRGAGQEQVEVIDIDSRVDQTDSRLSGLDETEPVAEDRESGSTLPLGKRHQCVVASGHQLSIADRSYIFGVVHRPQLELRSAAQNLEVSRDCFGGHVAEEFPVGGKDVGASTLDIGVHEPHESVASFSRR